jgi:hypothetical protein
MRILVNSVASIAFSILLVTTTPKIWKNPDIPIIFKGSLIILFVFMIILCIGSVISDVSRFLKEKNQKN